MLSKNAFSKFGCTLGQEAVSASLAQLAEHALRKRMVVGSIPTGGFSEFEEPLGALGLNYFPGK